MSLIYTTSSRSDLLRRAARLSRQAAYHAVKAQSAAASPHLAAAQVHHAVRFVELSDQARDIRREAKRHERPHRPDHAVRTAGWFSAMYFGIRLVVANVDTRHAASQIKILLVVFVEGELDESELHDAVTQLIMALNRDYTTRDWLHAEDVSLDSFTSCELPDGYCLTVHLTGEEPAPWSDEIPGQWEWLSSRGVAAR